MTNVTTTATHDAIVDLFEPNETLTISDVVQRARKAPSAALDGYYAPLAMRVHLDQLVVWSLLQHEEGSYTRPT